MMAAATPVGPAPTITTGTSAVTLVSPPGQPHLTVTR
jgi:hypothetical protein